MNDGQPVKLFNRLTLAASALILAVNLYVCRGIFRTDYTRHWGSIEGAYIGISRYILKHWHDFGWFPLWYGGIPFQNTYPPLLHMLVAGDAWLFGVSAARAHHAVSGAFYCLGPVALFFLLNALSRRLGFSLAAALLFSLTSPSALLMHWVRADMESVRNPRRLQTLLSYGDGPHIAGVTLVLVALLALHLALERGSAGWAWCAIAAFGSVVLTNWLATFALALACISYLLARSTVDRRLLRTAGVTAGISVIAFCLVVPWIPPSNLRDVQRNAQFVIGQYSLGAKQAGYWVILALLCAILWRLFSKYSVSQAVQFGSYLLLFTASLTMMDDWFGIYLMPQPHRYFLELEIAVAIVLAFGLGPVLIRGTGRWRLALIAVLLIAGVSQARVYRRFARYNLLSSDVHHAIEYEVGTWLDKNLPDQRVYASGSIQFWMNAFGDNPQLGGGFGQGISNPEIPALDYGIGYTSGDGERTAMWLRVTGVQAVVVTGPTGRDAYKAWTDSTKFQGVLPELWREGGEAIYGVPQRTVSLAHTIRPGDVVMRSPRDVTDVEPVHNLAMALEDPSLPPADLKWPHPSEARISADLKPEQLIFVQESYHPGWHATVSGESRPIRRDGLGFMVIEPRCTGACEIDLTFDGGGEMRAAYALRILGLLGAFGWMALWWRRHRRRHPAAGLH